MLQQGRYLLVFPGRSNPQCSPLLLRVDDFAYVGSLSPFRSLPSSFLVLTRYLLLTALLTSGLGAFAQATLTKLGSIAVPTYGTTLAVSGTTAYVLTASAGAQRLLIYDVSNSAAPRLVSFLDLETDGAPARHAFVNGTLLYVSTFPRLNTYPSSPNLLTIDVANPVLPFVRKAITVVGGTELFLAAKGTCVYALLDQKSLLYVFGSVPDYGTGSTVSLPYSLNGVLGLSVSGNTGYVQYANPAFSTLDLTVPTQPVSSAGTTPGTISTANGVLAYGLAQPVYATSSASNTLYIYNTSSPLAPTLVRALSGPLGTRVAAGEQCVYTVGATSPFLAAAGSSRASLRGYSLPAGAATAAMEAVDMATQGANDLAVVGTKAYVLTDTNLAIYSFPSTITATRGPASLVVLPLYPNPAHGLVSLPKLAVGTPVALYDVTGRCCLQAQLPASRTLDLSSLPAGLYQVRTPEATSKLLVE